MLIRFFLPLLVFALSFESSHAVGGTAYLRLGDRIYVAKTKTLPNPQERLARKFIDGLGTALRTQKPLISVAQSARVLQETENIIVALGEGALKEILRAGVSSQIIVVFVSKPSFIEVMGGSAHSRGVTAVFSDPSPIRQIALIKALLGEGASTGVIATSGDRKRLKEVLGTAKALGVRTQIANLVEHGDAKSAIQALKGTRTLLIQKNKALFDAIPLDTLMLLAYDLNDLGVIGYSSGVVKNGALATTYTSLEDTINSAAAVIRAIQSGGSLPPPDYSSVYSIVINKYVIRSLDIHEQDEQVIKEKISDLLSGAYQ